MGRIALSINHCKVSSGKLLAHTSLSSRRLVLVACQVGFTLEELSHSQVGPYLGLSGPSSFQIQLSFSFWPIPKDIAVPSPCYSPVPLSLCGYLADHKDVQKCWISAWRTQGDLVEGHLFSRHVQGGNRLHSSRVRVDVPSFRLDYQLQWQQGSHRASQDRRASGAAEARIKMLFHQLKLA